MFYFTSVCDLLKAQRICRLFAYSYLWWF